IEQWWRDYIDRPAFRLDEEIVAHQAEYAALLRTNSNRHARRGHLKQLSRRLSGPLYCFMTTTAAAKKLLLAGPQERREAA
ncbi:hypothetical protein LCGC14_2955440, partial [marine sediment metagenome]